jgi:uroporphyrinogen-III synthase
MDRHDFTNWTILVTRPRDQAEGLARRIEVLGGKAYRFPTIEIHPARHPDSVRARLLRLGDYEIAVFVSVNAVEHALALLSPERLPPGLMLAATGAATARELAAHGYADVMTPAERETSEGLAALPAMTDVRNRRIAILRGEGSGRDWLAETLAGRGADVRYIECYRRLPTDANPAPLCDALQAGSIHAVTATSVETLEGLIRVIGEAQRTQLTALPIACASDRIGTQARLLGFRHVCIATSASPVALTDALIEWRSAQHMA